MALLGVNIDHIATLRQARRIAVPSVALAAAAAMRGGADGVTVHLREDRRHIQDADVHDLVPRFRVNLEMAVTEEMIAFAKAARPHSVCLVPEKRQELTTEGGLDVAGNRSRVGECVARLRESGVTVSIFIDPEPRQIEAAALCGAEFVELHTGSYANRPGESELRKLEAGGRTAVAFGLRVNAGHGLDLGNVGAILGIEGLEELNIGFSIVARSVFIGLENAVREMKEAIS